ncbi:XRE family transcriptional regulator [Amycolatopsis pigmentata]|uniref:XRE family transcriptional regulator n=1 Tax=Amycolatopsis pigmentata TaxID=450801 RepID=A0ABW5FIY8_9PSEU
MSHVDDVIDAVGRRLREIRLRRGLTIAEVSAATGISASTLSRLESGKRRANLELLLPLSATYGAPLDDLVGAPYTGDPRVHIKPVRRGRQTFMSLTRRPGGLQAYKIIIPVTPAPVAPDLQTHEGYEWLYVLNGTLRLLLGDQDLVLRPGEVAEFATHVPHWLGAAGETPVEVLVLFGRQGERAHLRARTT